MIGILGHPINILGSGDDQPAILKRSGAKHGIVIAAKVEGVVQRAVRKVSRDCTGWLIGESIGQSGDDILSVRH